MKNLVYLITDTSGWPGDGKILFASMVEETRDRVYAALENRQSYRKIDRMFDLEQVRAEALKSLNGVDRMVLGLPSIKFL